jgi:hypothetical protein
MTRQLGGEPRFVTRRIGADTIIVPIASRTGDLDCVYTLNDVASRIWDELDTPRSAAEIAGVLAIEFDAPDTELMADIAAFLEILETGGLARQVETER